jgi:hypothetical protein
MATSDEIGRAAIQGSLQKGRPVIWAGLFLWNENS